MTPLRECPDPTLARVLDPILDAAVTQGRIAGAVLLVARAGALTYVRAAGMADIESARPMSTDTIFRAASLTKPMMTAAFLSLVEDGVMDLDDPVTRYLPEFTPKLDGTAPPITLRQLLTHTSGLSYGFLQPPDGPYIQLGVSDGIDQPGLSFEDELSRIVEAGLFFPPGGAWLYAVGLDVLGAAIEQATGKTLPQVIDERLTSKLGMRDSGFAVVDRARLATPYVDGPPPTPMGETHVVPFADLSGIRFAPDRVFDPTSFPSGGGGMACTAPDFLTFLEAIRSGGGSVVSPQTTEAMMTNQTGAHPILVKGPGWGFGFGGSVHLDPAASGQPLPPGLWSWGGVYGHSWAVDRTRELTFVLMTNTTLEGMSGPLSEEVMAAVLA